MKKLLVAGAIALFGLSNAQIAKGSTYLSGNLNFSTIDNNNNNTTQNELKLVPSVGYFVADNLAVGLGIGYANTMDKVENKAAYSKVSSNALVVEPFIRKYWGLGDKLSIFGQLSVPMAFGNVKSENNITSSKETFSQYGVVVKPGLNYFVSNNWAIEATLGEFGWNNSQFKNAQAVNAYKFGLNFDSVGLGVKYFFTKTAAAK